MQIISTDLFTTLTMHITSSNYLRFLFVCYFNDLFLLNTKLCKWTNFNFFLVFNLICFLALYQVFAKDLGWTGVANKNSIQP